VLVFYDGDCALCHGFVKFALPRTPADVRFAPIGGKTFRETFPNGFAADSVIVHRKDGRTLVRSDAVLEVLRLGWPRAIPRPIRDGIYRAIADIRRAVFGKPEKVCPIAPPELRWRLLD
jgi:predicted DCC family thiol-disulfide oxidoreductase YuxK